ncbi:hypothetical protein GOP47_0013824 [Adiantum capillus-veneris]|uniref:C2 domain-containing protein n=1 Tax=Adiantum capillus-veneris TaxID=13818 RepID=A0A9D4ZDL0_ADICA|nr:hypothetical protein GOP47_0013824 [Adiantum capillus-veneris]
MASLDLTLISATLSPDVYLDTEPKDIYATVKFGNGQCRSKTAFGHGRSPVWNETLTFNLDDQDSSKFIFVQLFAVRSDGDELLGVARILVPTSGEIEGSLHVLVSPSKGETGTLTAAGRWTSIGQQSESHSSFAADDMAKNRRNDSYASYPHTASSYEDVTSAFSSLAVGRGQGKEPYSSPAYPPVTYPPQNTVEERSKPSSSPYPPPADVYKDSYPPVPYPPKLDAYPPDYEKPSSSTGESNISKEREGKESSNTTMRGLGDTVDKGHHSHMPYGYPPPAMYGGGYPPPHGYPSQYGPPPGGYPPPPAYPPAAYSVAPSPYGYPPPTHSYPPTQPYPPYGYPPQASYPVHPGHGSYAPGMYVGHSSSGKHYKHHKMKMPKHSMYHYGHPQPHYPMHGHYYKHKKNKMFGKRLKFKGFKKFKY